MSLRRAAIVAPIRTAVGKFGGTLSPLTAGELGAVILKALVERTKIDPARVDDVVFSQGYGNGEAPAIGHWSWLAAGLPLEVPGYQLDRRCGSGLQAIANAAMMVQTGAGLLDAWQGLETGDINLTTPVFLVSPGQIFLGDFTAGNPHASQSLALWQDEMNPFGSTVDLSFPNPALFFYVTHANGNELFMTTTNADFQIDRPVKVDGEPPAVRSLNSILLMAVSNIARLIYLFDDNLIQDSIQLNKQDPVPYKPMALALSNALFRVSKVKETDFFSVVMLKINQYFNTKQDIIE